jgi:hypothetical protein
MKWLSGCGFYERVDMLLLFLKHFGYFCLFLIFSDRIKKEWLLGENCKYFVSFCKIQMVLNK